MRKGQSAVQSNNSNSKRNDIQKFRSHETNFILASPVKTTLQWCRDRTKKPAQQLTVCHRYDTCIISTIRNQTITDLKQIVGHYANEKIMRHMPRFIVSRYLKSLVSAKVKITRTKTTRHE